MKKTIVNRVILSFVLVTASVMSVSRTANATAGYAYSMGGLSTSVQQIIDSANNWALCGYSSYYNTDITYSYLGNSSVLNSSVVYMSGPGSTTNVKLENNLYFTSGTCNGTTNVGVTNYTLSQTKLYVINASYAGNGSSSLCNAIKTHGAKAVLGWLGSINVSDSTLWQQRFQFRCRNGYTISSSISYADSFNDYTYNNDIKNHYLYGNGTQTIMWSGSSSVGDEPDITRDNREVSIDEIECTYNNIDYDALEDVISAYDHDFDMSDYETSVVSTSEDNKSFVVDITKKIGDFSTSSGYTFIFTNEKTNVMYDNTIDNVIEFEGDLSAKSAQATAGTDEAYEIAALDIEDGYYIIDQLVTKYYDMDTGIFYNKVNTECKENYGDCCYAYSTLVPVK